MTNESLHRLPHRATSHGEGARVEPPVAESLLREVLTLLEAVQDELNQRWNSQGSPGCHAEHA